MLRAAIRRGRNPLKLNVLRIAASSSTRTDAVLARLLRACPTGCRKC